jgi:NAD(P)-dependent dehydrogenase (short-subunit alcohol dehydrogenase family)
MGGRFAGKVALVTGGSSGIGRAAALAFAREGAIVVLASRGVERGDAAAAEVRAAGGEAVFVPTDVSRAAEVQALVNRVAERYGRLDCAVNNAGAPSLPAPAVECTEAYWDEVMAVNLKGVWLCLKYEIPLLLRGDGGAIVNTASVIGQVGMPGVAAYVASKHGVVGLTKAAALECALAGVRVNAVCPGVIHTPGVERFVDGDTRAEAMLTSLMPLGRLGTPEEVAAAVLWLCSDAASFVTGHALLVDGGWAAR